MNFLLSILALVIGFLVAVFATRRLIPLLKRIKLGQEIREEGPQSHLQKQGTPTMGGVVFLPAVALATFIGNGINRYSVFLVLCATLFGLIGFLDDGLKLLHHRSLGLRAWQKNCRAIDRGGHRLGCGYWHGGPIATFLGARFSTDAEQRSLLCGGYVYRFNWHDQCSQLNGWLRWLVERHQRYHRYRLFCHLDLVSLAGRDGVFSGLSGDLVGLLLF